MFLIKIIKKDYKVHCILCIILLISNINFNVPFRVYKDELGILGSVYTTFLDDGILRERVFRQKVADIDWSQYSDKRVLIKGCSEVPIPTWAYLILTAELSQHVQRIYFGELRSAVKIFTKGKE